MSKITQKNQVLVEEYLSPLVAMLNPVPLCRPFLTHWDAERWHNGSSYSACDFMVQQTVSENQGALGSDRQYII